MNARQGKAAARLRELITEGEAVALLERPSSVGPYIQDKVRLHAWLVKVDNITKTTFGADSPHYSQLTPILARDDPSRADVVRAIIGILTGALDDLEGGFLQGQEHLIAGEILDSVLEEARQLSKSGYKDAAAFLARVVVEDALRRLCRSIDLPDVGKAADLNNALRDAGQYSKPQWRIVQSWLDVGNAAAHGKFDDYTADDVMRMIDGVGRFVAENLRV